MLAHLSHQTQRKDYRFKRLFRNLYNPLFYELFFTPADGEFRQQIPTFITKLQTGDYRPKAYHLRQRFDQMIAQCVTAILSAIYVETTKEMNLHKKIFTPFLSSIWLLSGQIERRNNSLNLNFLKEKIADRKFLTLILHLEQSGYLRLLLRQLAYIDLDKKVAQHFPDLVYVRVKDWILVGANSTKQEAHCHKEALVKMIEERYGLSLNVKGKSIYHRKERIPFRQYSLQLPSHTNKATFFIEKAELVRQLQNYRVVRIGGKGEIIAVHRPYLLNLCEKSIIASYRRDFHNITYHFRYAANRNLLRLCQRYMKESMLKTMAYKRKTSVKKIAKSMRDCRIIHN